MIKGKPTGGSLTTWLYAVLAFGLVPTTMVFNLLEPLLGQGVLAHACYWTMASTAMVGLARRCFSIG